MQIQVQYSVLFLWCLCHILCYFFGICVLLVSYLCAICVLLVCYLCAIFVLFVYSFCAMYNNTCILQQRS